MTPREWGRLKDLFNEAVEGTEGERIGLIEGLRASEPGVASELELLLEQHDSASTQMSTSPFSGLAELGIHESYEPGDLLAERFRILRLVGHGGMGEVYEAEDQKLGGRVAVKMIRPAMAWRESMLAGFRREIQLSRRVTHPNVCRIHDIAEHQPSAGASGGAPVLLLTMEFLAGETLSAVLKKQGRLPAEKVLPLIEQLAEGLAAAHSAGVIHGDFKPGNVMMVPQNGGAPRPMITDFGLARPLTAQDQPAAPPLAGTLEYMAPEVCREGALTPAVDVYSFGKTIARMAEKPSQPGKAAAWERVLERCTDADPVRRYPDPRDAARALREVLYPQRIWRRRAWAAAAVVATLMAFLLIMRGRPQQAGVVDRKVADDHIGAIKVTPDGSALAGPWGDDFGNLGLYWLETGKFAPLTKSKTPRREGFGVQGGRGVAYSPDGQAVAFFWRDEKASIELRTVSLRGENEQTVSSFQGVSMGAVFDWSPRGRILGAVVHPGDGCELFEADPAARKVTRRGMPCPKNAIYSADGTRILVDRDQAARKGDTDIVELDLDTGEERSVVTHPKADHLVCLTPDRRELLFRTNRRGVEGLWKIALDGGREYQPVELRADIGDSNQILGMSRQGVLFYRREFATCEVYLTQVDLAQGRMAAEARRVMPEVLGTHDSPEWSPDGTRLLFKQAEPRLKASDSAPYAKISAQYDATVYVLELVTGRARSTPCRTPLFHRGVLWDAHGSRLVGPGTGDDGGSGYFECDPGTGKARMIAGADVLETSIEGVWSPDGAVLYDRFAEGRRGIFAWHRKSGEKTVLYVPPEDVEIPQRSLALSPDGKWLAFEARNSKAHREALMLMPAGGGEVRELFWVERPPRRIATGPFTWAPDGRSLLAAVWRDDATEVWQVWVDGRNSRRLEAPARLMCDLRLNRDGHTLAYGGWEGSGGAEIWALENLLR
jgi:Tol biopolymer transport system component/tRNA A-37 threonylcarbamoyl transferase component Bud32